MARNTAVNLDIRPLSDGFSAAGGTTPRTLQLDGGNVHFVSQASTDALTLPNSAATNLLSESYATAKGDILAATASNAISRVAVGTNGQVLTADSGASNGVSWQTPSSTAYWTTVVETTTSRTAASGEEIITNNAALVTVTVPGTAAVGDHFRVRGLGAGGWRVQMNTGQTIRMGSVASTTAGQANSTNQYDEIEFTCVVANTTFLAMPAQGNPDFV